MKMFGNKQMYKYYEASRKRISTSEGNNLENGKEALSK